MPREQFPKLVSILVTGLLCCFQAGAQAFKPACPSPSFPTPSPKTAPPIDSLCGATGQPGQSPAETAQNTAKDNFCATKNGGPITVAQMRDLQTQVQNNKAINFGSRVHPLSAQPGPATDRTPLAALGEGQLRMLEGYVLIARQEGKESVNCETTPPNVPASHDIHISIVADVSQVHGNECESVVAEMSPHHRPDAWNEANVQAVALGHKRVRVTGHLFFDSSHTPCIDGKAEAGDPHRSSLWEIHPIYKFEVCPGTGTTCASGGWMPLDQWIVKKP
jgi:hypothetical protein